MQADDSFMTFSFSAFHQFFSPSTSQMLPVQGLLKGSQKFINDYCIGLIVPADKEIKQQTAEAIAKPTWLENKRSLLPTDN